MIHKESAETNSARFYFGVGQTFSLFFDTKKQKNLTALTEINDPENSQNLRNIYWTPLIEKHRYLILYLKIMTEVCNLKTMITPEGQTEAPMNISVGKCGRESDSGKKKWVENGGF